MMQAQYKETPIGKIPNDWEVVRLGEKDIAKIIMGQSPPSTTYNNIGNGLPFLQGKAEFGEIYPSPSVYCSNPIKIAEPNDILLAVRAPVGEVNIAPFRCCIGRGLAAIRLGKDRLDHLFLFYYLKFNGKRFEIISSGSTFKAIRKEDIENYLIPLPPIPEQKKIAEILSTVDKAIELTDEIIAQTELLKKGLMQRLLTKGIGHEEFKFSKELGCEIPKEWEVTTIGEVCEVGTGGTPSREKTEYFGGNIPWVKSTEIDYGIITQTEEYITELGLKNSNARIYSAGTLIIAMYGQGVTRGKCAILGIDAAINQACAAIKPKNSNLIHILYLYYWCQYRYEQIRNLGQGANQKNLNLSIVRSIKFPLPPLPEQKRISKILSTVDKKLELERERKQQLQELKKGLMQVLLTGKVRVKVDKNGNPTRETHQNSR